MGVFFRMSFVCLKMPESLGFSVSRSGPEASSGVGAFFIFTTACD